MCWVGALNRAVAAHWWGKVSLKWRETWPSGQWKMWGFASRMLVVKCNLASCSLGRGHVWVILIRQQFPLGEKVLWISRHWPVVQDWWVLIPALIDLFIFFGLLFLILPHRSWFFCLQRAVVYSFRVCKKKKVSFGHDIVVPSWGAKGEARASFLLVWMSAQLRRRANVICTLCYWWQA